MDMGIRLNVSYPVAKPVSDSVGADKSAAVDTTQPVRVVDASAKSESNSSSSERKDDEQVKAAAAEIQDFFQSVKRNLEFSVDDRSGKVVVKVIASDSGEVIRQIPNEEVLKLAESLSDASSLLFSAKA